MALVYVVEDDRNIQEIEVFALKNGGYEVEGFSSATEFYAQLKKRVPDLILLDIMLPDEDGLQILEKLRSKKETKKVPIIMVTAKASEIDKVKGLDMGADDYISKPFGVMELISRVKALLRRSMETESEKQYRLGSILLDDEKHKAFIEGEICELTFKEYELLKLLIQNVGLVLRREVIMTKVWGTDFEGESRTIDMHIKTLRQKLKAEGERIKTVRNVGYRME